MINQQLIDILNSGEAWAFVGSGCSVNAGLPSWQELLVQSAEASAHKFTPLPHKEKQEFQVFQAKNELPQAFSVLKSYYGSAEIDSIVSHIIGTHAAPGEVTRMLAKWPFAAYITSNYDDLIERAIKSFGGWIPVGNTAAENTKICGDVRHVIWHPHGGANLGSKNTRLVLATTDYDEIYSAGSPTLAALEAVCRMKQLVFIGFGFKDADLVKTLQKIGRLITPNRPAFGFIANCNQKERDEYWQKYKIDIIPYIAKGNDHSDLLNVMKAYGVFVLDRGLRFGNVAATPDYDIETVGLLTHNRLMRTGWQPERNALECITRGFILAQLRNSPMSIEQLVNSMPQPTHQAKEAIRKIIDTLIANKIISVKDDLLRLTKDGDTLALQGKADYEVARDQFRQSILTRADELCPDKSLIDNVSDVAIKYLERTCRERGLGVAQQLAETGGLENRARTVAMLQGMKLELQYATNRDAAFNSLHCIWQVLSAPRSEEKRYLGLLTQAYFGRQLVGTDPSAIGIQQNILSSTVFIADSNFIIPLLAEGSPGHKYALTLYQKLVSLNCRVVTSDFLLVECVEHAQWAWKFLNNHGSISSETIDAARGARGYRPNAFLFGYLYHPEFGPNESFKRFFARLFDSNGELPQDITVADCLRKKGIIVQQLSLWEGFTDELYAERDILQQEIERRRRKNSTYTHERQVKAEAEVALLVSHVRRRELRLTGHETLDAFFLSHSRVVDNLPNQAHRVCLSPESLLEWILSIGEIKEDESNAVFDQLLWEISKEGVDVVPRLHLLRLFHNTIDVSREKLEGVISDHRQLIREHYAMDPDKAFLDVDPLIIPNIADELSREVLKTMENRLKEEQSRRQAAEISAKKTLKEREEYARLKAEKTQRQVKTKRKKRAAQSAPGKKKKHKSKNDV